MAGGGRLLNDQDERFARFIDQLCYENPFSPRRLELEQLALGSEFVARGDAWNLGPGHRNSNLVPLVSRTLELLRNARPKLSSSSNDQRKLYGSLVRYAVYFEFTDAFAELARTSLSPGFGTHRVALFRDVRKRISEHIPEERLTRELFGSVEHLFAIMFQLRRAFENIFETIVGRSEAAQELRAAVWQSVFTHDMRRYERTLYGRMHDTNTLILGPSGTGKELVARAIGLSRYLPFDKKSLHFEEFAKDAFFALNVGALSPTLVESELFGHKRGSFTGAVADHAGWLELCPEHGTVFLDEIGDLDPAIQVKLLRVLQSREFHRVGESKPRRFSGKVVAATNKDLHTLMQQGAFREDLYYRLCSDVIETPPLWEQLKDEPEDLERLVSHVAKRIVEPEEVDGLVSEVTTFIRRELGMNYAWPGNVRELEQCVRSIVVRGTYQSAGRSRAATDSSKNDGGLLRQLADSFVLAKLPAERQLDVYVTLSYFRTGNYAATGRSLGLDRRTVKARIDTALLERLRSEASG
jgi:DNA-binding NtrC family response regulator